MALKWDVFSVQQSNNIGKFHTFCCWQLCLVFEPSVHVTATFLQFLSQQKQFAKWETVASQINERVNKVSMEFAFGSGDPMTLQN